MPQPMELRTLPDGRQGFVCYSLGNFISSQTKPLTNTTAVLTLTLSRDNETGAAQVEGYAYAPMYMLHRQAAPRFELLDIHAALEDEATGKALRQKLEKALEDCHAVFGPEQVQGPERQEELPKAS